MNKALALFLFVAGLIAFAQAADIAVKVGGPNAGSNIFDPAMIMAAPGDNIVFTWVSGKHSILQEDKAKDCAKSTSATAFINSGGAFEAPKTWTLVAPKEAGKTWFYCGVPGHCTPGTGGMEALLVVGDGGAPAAGGDAPKDGAAPKEGGAAANGTTPAAPGGSPAPSAASRNYNTFVSAGVVFSSMCMAAAYML